MTNYRYIACCLILLTLWAGAQPANAQERKLNEIARLPFPWSYYPRPDAWFVNDDGTQVVVLYPLLEFGNDKTTGLDWEVRVIDIESGEDVSTRKLSFGGTPLCEDRWSKFGPDAEMVGTGPERRLVVRWCQEGELWAVPSLETIGELPEFYAAPSRTGQYYLLKEEGFSATPLLGGGFSFGGGRKGPTGPIPALRLVEATSGRLVCSIETRALTENEDETFINRWDFSHDDRYLYLEMQYGAVRGLSHEEYRIYDIEKCEVLSRSLIPGHGRRPFDGRLAGPVGQYLLSEPMARGDKGIMLWDWSEWKIVKQLRSGRVWTVQEVSPDGNLAILRTPSDPRSDRSIRDFNIWDLRTQNVIARHPRQSGRELRKRFKKYFRSLGRSGKIEMEMVFGHSVRTRFSQNGHRILHLSSGQIIVYSLDIAD